MTFLPLHKRVQACLFFLPAGNAKIDCKIIFRGIKMHKSAIIASILLMSACSMTLPVKGRMTDGSETFTGTATGYMDGGGTLKLVSTQGRTCTGDFVYVTRRNGEGVFTCDDGNSGPFTFVSTGTRGTGKGTLGGQDFTFTFGS